MVILNLFLESVQYVNRMCRLVTRQRVKYAAEATSKNVP